MNQRLRVIATVLRKELVDALRDRRTLLTVFITSVLMGPLVLVAISALVASLEARAEQREIYIAGFENAPSLRNFFARQTYTVKAAPADYEAQLRKATFSHPVVVVPVDFEAALVRGEAPVVEVVADSANTRSQAGVPAVERLLNAFGRERVALTLALRGVSVQLLEPIQVEDRDLASTQTRATRITGILPYFVLMAVL
ncbi:MAG: ABC transporter permease, partial [Caldimonas sp.]